MNIRLTPEQIENIRAKYPDFDFDKWLKWKEYIDEELCKPHALRNVFKKGCEL